ncbi:MAG: hypothetical protein ACFE95_12605 [Candidatus Hodarchaeota archaeon]
MKEEKVRLLWTIFNQLGLKEIPSSMVSRRMTVFKAFDENNQAFLDPLFAQRFWNMFEEGKTQKVSVLSEGKITPNHIFSFINDNQNLWTEAFACEDEGVLVQEESDIKKLEQYKEITERNKIQQTQPGDSLFFEKLFSNLIVTDAIPYPDYEKEILYLMEGMSALYDENILDEAIKAYVQAIYKGDATNSYRLLLEEFNKNQEVYKKLGLSFSYPELKTGEGRISRMMDATYIASTFSSGVFELRRIISIVNRIGEVGFSENEILKFFKAYLDGGLDNILLNPPDNKSYFKRIEKTIDYDFKINLKELFPILTCVPKELTPLFSKILNIMTRVKIVEWSKNVPIGEETTIIDLLFETQKNCMKIMEENADELVSLEEMFMLSNANVINNVIEYFSNKLAYSYLLGIRKGGIGKELLDSFRNLSSPRGLGIQILDLKNYYEQIYSVSWQREFYYDFVLGIASKGLSSSRKETVRERVNLLVQKDPKQARRQQDTRKKIASELIFDALKQAIPFLRPNFTTAEGAQEYFGRTFLSIKTALNMAWIKKILRTGFDLYIEHPVTHAWTNEMEDLSREMIRYAQNLTTLNRPSSEINELLVESLREAFGGLYYVNQSHVDQEVLSLFLKLPETPSIIDLASVQKYLDSAFQESKTIINNILGREVEEEFERKTFDQEIEERISLANNVIDWYVKSINTFYDHAITESISLEKSTDPNETLLKTLYGGVFFLIEESMDLLLSQDEKLTKASFLKELFFKQVTALKSFFMLKKIDYNYQILIDYVLEQIELWDSAFRLRAILTDLEGDNRLRRAVDLSHTSEIDYIKTEKSSYSFIEEPSIRGLAARELVVQWIKKWANSVINLAERILSDISHSLSDEFLEKFEEEIYELLFTSTGRDDIRNFMIPLILGNVKGVTGFETCCLPQEFSLNYGTEVFSEVVKCDSQLSLYFLAKNWTEIKSEDRIYKEKMLGGSVDFVSYLGTRIESCRQLIGSRELKLSDVVKKATGLSLSGLKLQTIVFQLGNEDIFSAATYAENPFEGSEVTGLTLELITKDNIPIGNLLPLCENASEVLAGLIERNSNNVSNPDSLYKAVVRQLLDEAKLILVYDSGTLKERLIQKSLTSRELLNIRDISRTALRITSAYKIKIKRILQNDQEVLLPEDVSYFGEKLENFGLFVQLIFPFFEPAQHVKERLMDDQQLMNTLGISKRDDFQKEMIFPSLVVFDDNGSYKVILGTYDQDILKMVIAEEDTTSKMGLRTIQYLLKTRSSFTEFTTEIGLIPLPELNRSIPLNLIKVLKEKDGIMTIDFKLIKDIQLGAI